MSSRLLGEALGLLRSSAKVVVSTGAGMSSESGIPTFRDAQEGLWARFDPEELATEAGFRAAPARVWGWYASRRYRILASSPNAGHLALTRLQEAIPAFTIVTQNIDGLHQAAGSRRVIELHGSILRAKCLDLRHPFEGELPIVDVNERNAEALPPACPTCGSALRPDVVWFGEPLPEEAVREAWRAAEECDLMLVVGTSGVVWPAADLPFVAARAGARVVEINPEPSEVTPITDLFLRGRAGAVLHQLAEQFSTSTP